MENTGQNQNIENDNLEKVETINVETKITEEIQEEVIEVTSEEKVEEQKTTEQPISESNTEENTDNSTEIKTEVEEKSEPEILIPEIIWAELKIEDILTETKKLINDSPIAAIKEHITLSKNEFYKKLKEEANLLKEQFISDGGIEEEFKIIENKFETEFKQYLNIFRDKKQAYYSELEKEKENNLKRKEEIISEIKNLVNSQEKINVTFQEFKKLQDEFNKLGDIPQKDYKTIWNNFNTSREIFYDYLDINKELRDYDFKKSLKQKETLCEKAEAIVNDDDIIASHKILQGLHESWKKIGPVHQEKREEIWERFSAITKTINKKHQDYYDSLKDIKNKNFELKEKLCADIEAISEVVPEKINEWNEKAKEIEKIQKDWKEVGPTPKNTNKEIYKRFRTACDNFYNKRKEFFNEIKKEQQLNLQHKYDLCEQVEGLKDSTEWKETTTKIINIQKQWKNSGPVPRKKADQVWSRFRSACDDFFNKKSEHFAGQSEKEKENLILKEELIKNIEAYEHSDDTTETIKQLKEFQSEWNKIGYVPLNNKKDINTSFKNILNKHYDNLKIDSKEKDILRLKSKLEELSSHPDSIEKLRIEKDKLLKRISQFESDAVLLENNIGFFNVSKNSEHLLKDIKNKINTARENIDLLKDKLKVINQHINKEVKKNN